MKENNCNKSQILNPKTKRCINKNTKKAIEILFQQKDKEILKKYEIVDNKIVKKCEKPKNRNPETKKCVKDKKIEVIKKSKSLDKKIEAIKKVKRALLPFINRVSADIYNRNKYLLLMRRELKNKKKGCLRIYKKNVDGTFSYRIGNRIILKKRIGSDSVYGVVYLSEFREKEKKLFTFASKVYKFIKSRTTTELEIFHKLTDIVRMDKCPHFPIFYGYLLCDNFMNFEKDSFKKSNKNDKIISQKMSNFPELVQYEYGTLITTFTELANGDILNFFKLYHNNSIFIINGLIQQILSIMFFNYHTNKLHMDTHTGNFLYHKIKAGGYFHYELFGVDYYLENIGILWVIWDFDFSIDIDKPIEEYYKKMYNIKMYGKNNDYFKLIKGYIISKDGIGYNNDKNIEKNKELYDYILKLYSLFDLNYKEIEYNLENLKDFIYKIPLLLDNLKLNNKFILLKKLPKGCKIINKNPYKIDKNEFLNKNISIL
jgi:hypothetical protein